MQNLWRVFIFKDSKIYIWISRTHEKGYDLEQVMEGSHMKCAKIEKKDSKGTKWSPCHERAKASPFYLFLCSHDPSMTSTDTNPLSSVNLIQQ